MKSIKDIYRYGFGPSSSHTIAPYRAANLYRQQYGDADCYEVIFRGSLALTGKGHHSDSIVEEALKPAKTSFIFDCEKLENEMLITGIKDNISYPTWHILSLGGGSIRIKEFDSGDEIDIYKENSFKEIIQVLEEKKQSLLAYIYKYEPDLKDYLLIRIDEMIACVKRGITSEGLLCEPLNYYRCAKKLYENREDENDCLVAYAYAAGEENAAGGKMVTAPTLGSAGIVASLVYYMINDLNKDKELIADALAIGGLFGNLIKENASIAGSIGGCQAEVGTACAMASAMIAYLNNKDLLTIERAAEIAIEHHLGLTCDPVKGYVIIPCIERNGAAILRAFDAYRLANSLSKVGKSSLVSFDMAVMSMNYTGKKIPIELKETSLGGLALEFENEKN